MPNQQSDDHIPAIVLDKEDIKSKKLTDKAHKEIDKPQQQTAKPSVFPIILTLVVFSVCAWFLYQQNNVLIQSQSRITSLENQLSATGEEMGSSAVAMQVKVKDLSEKTQELWKQMDKLWASAWRRNQNDIGELQGDVSKYKALQAKQQEVVNSALIQQKQLTNNFNKQLAIKSKSIQELKETLLEFEMKSADSESKISNLTVQLHELTKQYKKLHTQLNDIESTKTSSDVKSIQP
jgi:DNA repair exonuclease SbcCD ATPase subunit